MAADGSDIGSEGFEYDSVVNVQDIDIQSCAQSFADKVLQNLGATKTDAFKGPALLSPEAALDLFHILIIAASATAIQSGQSLLQDRQGEEIAIKDLTLTDNGSIHNSPASGSFDREGLPHQNLRIIDSGVFKDIYYNAFTANKAELESTGHASGGFRSLPSVQTTNLEILGGSKSFEDIISGIDKGVYIQRVRGFTRLYFWGFFSSGERRSTH
ncbi:MAG: metallopeptidase TldD-related protein [Candidatus Thorarchaeota archaeon]